VEAVARGAARDANGVGLFLNELGLRVSPDRPLLLAAGFLLDLGAALRLLEWERRGLQAHLQAGLPPARIALWDVCRTLGKQPDPAAVPPGALASRVLAVFVERFAWNARAELNAEVVLAEGDEEQVLEALADYLWEHRPR